MIVKNHNIIKMYSLYLPNARMSQSAVTHLPLKSLSTAKLGKKQRDYKETNLSITDSKFLSKSLRSLWLGYAG